MRFALKATIAAFAATTALGLAAAQAQEERSFDVDDFDRIDVSAGVILVAEIGEPKAVIVKTDHGDFSDFEISVRNGALHVTRDFNRLSWHKPGGKAKYKVVLTTPSLRALDASSGSHAKITNVKASRFVVDLSSGAHASLEGTCENCVVDLSSGAHLDAKSLSCDSASVDVSSGGFGEITASRAVVADASSGGYVTVYGNPQRVSIDKSSGGRIYVASTAQAKN